ncbi:MAG: TonB-dependent receptor [Xanthomonadales bacterium]|nr:TonB-dependent receptor [Xanthomonadales bacterium]
MTNRFRLCISALTILLVLMVPAALYAQETTSAIRVTVYGPDGNPLSGVSVTTTDTRTGGSRTSQTNASGLVLERQLAVGGPYTVKASAENFADQTVTEIDLRLGDTYTVVLQLGSAAMEEVVVTAAQIRGQQMALGPAAVFGLEDLQDMPAINRDLRDIVRNDPRLYIDPAFAGGAIHCAGANPRFNSLTVDGVRMNDQFGLNSNGYPTERQPFSYDVFYGQFTACNINAVTKSGSNEWHGSAFYDYTSDALKGDKLEDEDIDTGDFDETRYGVTLGGPIMKDKLFFFVAYEKLDGANQFDRVPDGAATSGRVIRGVSQEQLDEIYAIAQDLYGYTPGAAVRSLPNEDEKYTIKLDWDINEDHRANYTYNYNDGFNWAESDSDDNEYEFTDHFYERGAELKSHTGALFSNWTEQFSTEVRVSALDLENRQISRAGGEIGEVQIRTLNDDDGDGQFSSATVYMGTDDSRHTNYLNYEALNFKLAGNYALGDHLLTAGYEQDDLDVFNLFIQETRGEYRFDEECNSSNPNGCIEEFREGRPDDIYYQNSTTGNPNDAAAEWSYKIHTAYLQDEWVTLGGDLTVVAGLRYEWYSSSDRPTYNAKFEERNGFANTETLDGEDLIQPRLGFNWTVTPDVSVHGGVGLYSGGNPNVWLSNNFSNDGIRIARLRETIIERNPPPAVNCGLGVDFSLFDIPLSGNGEPLRDVPQCLVDAATQAEPNFGVNALDPDFEIPKNWKVNLGTVWQFGVGYTMNADLLYTDADDSALIVGSTMEQTSTAPDGRPVYTDSRAFNTDYILTNVTGPDAESWQASISLSKYYDNGFDWSVGYAYTDSKDVNPMTSSVAFSNYANVSVDDPNGPSLANSNYNIPQRFTFRIGYSAYWWDDNRTNFTLVGAHNEGRPYSYTFANDDGDTFGDFISDRHLLFVPDGPTDPRVIFADTFDTEAFFDFVEASGLNKYGHGIAPRNAFNSDWWTWFDLRVEQEFPGFMGGDKFAGFIIIKNFCNLLNDEWCVLREAGFPGSQPIVDMEISEDGSAYIFEEFIDPPGQGRVSEPSLWEVRVGVTYRF